MYGAALGVGRVAAPRDPRGTSRAPAHDADDGQTELPGELEVALVVARHGHDGAGAVLHQHVVGDPDRDLLAGGRVDGVAAGEDAGLLPLAHLAGDQVLRRGGLAVRLDRRRAASARDQAVHQRVLGRQHHEGGAEDGVGPGGEDPDRPSLGRVAVGLRRSPATGKSISAPSDRPSQLRCAVVGAVGPVHLRLVVQIGQQPVGVLGDPEEPLLQRPLLHRACRSARTGR